MNAQLYRRPNRRKCYWLCGECLKGHTHRCSTKCPDYLSVARAERIKREGDNAYQVEHRQGE
jgi:hypothetical protein